MAYYTGQDAFNTANIQGWLPLPISTVVALSPSNIG